MRAEDVMRAANRFEVLTKAEKGLLKMVEAAAILGLSDRQVRRLRARIEAHGLKGLFYRREHPAPNRVSEAERAEIVALRRKVYRAYNLTHFRDVMRQRHGIKRSREFYRRLFLLKKLYNPAPAKRRKSKHRKRFEAPKAGVLIQRDTSIHFWIPGAEKPWKLILDLDDHSRKITGALFSERDDVLSNMLVAWETVSTHGIPFAYYTDNNPVYNPLNKKPRQGMYHFYRERSGDETETLSQFKRALKELGVECIHATPYQPQGKGKIERIFRFMQDRLVKEMTTAGVQTIGEANKYLKKWIEWYNHCHVHSVTKQVPNERYLANDAFRPVPGDVDLEQVFCLKYERKVKADNTFQFEGKTYQIPKNEYRISYAKAKVEMRIYLSRIMKVFHERREIGCYRYKLPTFRGFQQAADILALQL
jgi:transposase InsO family protein